MDLFSSPFGAGHLLLEAREPGGENPVERHPRIEIRRHPVLRPDVAGFHGTFAPLMGARRGKARFEGTNDDWRIGRSRRESLRDRPDA